VTRARLWSLTTIACLLLALPGVPAGWRAGVVAGTLAAWAHLGDAAPHALLLSRTNGALAIAAGVTLIALGSYRLNRRGSRFELVTAMARRGRPVALIARRSGLAQDAVRDLLGGDPVAVSTATRGSFFRRRKAAPSESPALFADALQESSFDATP
jgi:hypothetical protein